MTATKTANKSVVRRQARQRRVAFLAEEIYVRWLGPRLYDDDGTPSDDVLRYAAGNAVNAAEIFFEKLKERS